MISTIKKHLTFVYTLTSGFILTIIILILFMLTQARDSQYQKDEFVNIMDSLIYKLQLQSTINIPQLRDLEVKNNLIIYIEDGGAPTTPINEFIPETDRNSLISAANHRAVNEGIIKSAYPSASSTNKTSVFNIKGVNKEQFFACVAVVPTNSSWRSLIIIQKKSSNLNKTIKNICFFIFLELLGIFLLYIISLFFVKRAIKPIEENFRLQNDFIASASHELRSPLALIKSDIYAIKSRLAKEKLTDSSEYFNEHLKDIDFECSRMAKLVNDMLLLASSGSATFSISRKEIDSDTLIIDCYEILNKLCRTENRNLSLILPECELGRLSTDYERVLQILTILINNAVSYTPKDSTIELTANINKGALNISVIDHGTGISDNEKKHIFDAYYRSDKSRTDKAHYGLGLNIAKQLTTLLDGKLKCSDTYKGGATFTVSLPLLII